MPDCMFYYMTHQINAFYPTLRQEKGKKVQFFNANIFVQNSFLLKSYAHSWFLLNSMHCHIYFTLLCDELKT